VTEVANTAECEASCVNNVKCELYESWYVGKRCMLFSFASGVTSVNRIEVIYTRLSCPGCFTAIKTTSLTDINSTEING
jgi:hypothetical protein